MQSAWIPGQSALVSQLAAGGTQGPNEETHPASVHLQRTEEERKEEQEEKMEQFILRNAEPKDVSDILRLIKVLITVLIIHYNRFKGRLRHTATHKDAYYCTYYSI